MDENYDKYRQRHMCMIVWHMMYDRETSELIFDKGQYTLWICYGTAQAERDITRTLKHIQHGEIFSSLLIEGVP